MLIASQQALYQGFISDSQKMLYTTSNDKQTKILNSIQLLINQHNKDGFIPAKMAASVLGKVQSLKRSHGSIVSVIPRCAQNELGKQVLEKGWNVNISFSKGIDEFQFFLQNLHLFNGKAIALAKAGAQTVSQQEVAKILRNITDTSLPIPGLLISDASADRSFCLYHGNIVELISCDFTNDQKLLSSGFRELLAVITFLQYQKSVNKTFSRPIVYWETDSQLSYFYLHHGSRNAHIQSHIIQIKRLELELGVTIIPVWTKRSHCRIMLADQGSRFSADLDDWSIPKFMLSSIFTYFNCEPSIDGFASDKNSVCNKYVSKYLDNNNICINFFAHDPIEGEVYYLCPPPAVIGDTIRKIEISPGSKFILVMPMWTSAPWWPLIHDGKTYHRLVKSIFIFDCKVDIHHKPDIKTIFDKTMKFIALYMFH